MMEKPYWEGNHYAFFSNKECEYFPCHKGADPENFNCLFCYCPLYALGDKCGGNFRITEKGIKDCTNCQLPHKAKNYGYVTGKYSELAELMREMRENREDQRMSCKSYLLVVVRIYGSLTKFYKQGTHPVCWLIHCFPVTGSTLLAHGRRPRRFPRGVVAPQR